MFIESCEVQLSSAIVVCMLQYLNRSLQKHAQNMSIQLIHRMKKKKHLQSFVFVGFFFSFLFKDIVHPEVLHCQKIREKESERCKSPERKESQVKMVLQSELM